MSTFDRLEMPSVEKDETEICSEINCAEEFFFGECKEGEEEFVAIRSDIVVTGSDEEGEVSTR